MTSAHATPPVAWVWSRFAYGAVLGVPAAIGATADPRIGLGMAVGMLPAAAAGLAPSRRARRVGFVVSVVAAASFGIGAVLGLNAVLAVSGLFVLGLVAAAWAARAPGGRLALLMAYPLVGIGLSFDPSGVLVIAGVMILSGLYAWLVSLLWPERPAPQPPAEDLSPNRQHTTTYGVLLGLAGATAAAVGFGFDLDHKGWLCGAALMVMRPVSRDLTSRGLGRAVSVLLGAVAGSAFVALVPSPWVIGLALLLALAALAATAGSHWYVAPAFTTFVVFVLLLWDHPTDTAWRFAQRNVETVTGILIALVFGVVGPLFLSWRSRSRPA